MIIRICASKYNVKTTTNRIIIHFHDIFNTIDNPHNKLNIGINGEVCNSWFTKNFYKIIEKFHVLLNCPQTTNPIL
jgi:hypothetical protein